MKCIRLTFLFLLPWQSEYLIYNASTLIISINILLYLEIYKDMHNNAGKAKSINTIKKIQIIYNDICLKQVLLIHITDYYKYTKMYILDAGS